MMTEVSVERLRRPKLRLNSPNALAILVPPDQHGEGCLVPYCRKACQEFGIVALVFLAGSDHHA